VSRLRGKSRAASAACGIYAVFTRAAAESAAMELLILFLAGAVGVAILLARLWRRRDGN
jgi:hypothetical protein